MHFLAAYNYYFTGIHKDKFQHLEKASRRKKNSVLAFYLMGGRGGHAAVQRQSFLITQALTRRA